MNESTINEINMAMGEDNLETILDKALLPVREKVLSAYDLSIKGKLDDVKKLCEEILEVQPDFPEIQFLLVQCLYYSQKNLKQAVGIMRELRKQCPGDTEVLIMSGKVCHATGGYQEAARYFSRVFPLKEYQPFVCQLYGDTLEHLGQPEKALSMYHIDLEQYEKTGEIPHIRMLDGSFQNTLHLDITWNSRRFARDLELYIHFLDQLGEESKDIQEFISDTVIYISHELARKWLRTPFLRLLDFLKERDILRGEFELTVYSGYISLESYRIHEDKSVSSFVEDYFSNISGRIYDERQEKNCMMTGLHPVNSEEDAGMQQMNRVKYLTYNWYMCRYFHEHLKEMEYVKDAYPHTWDMAEECITRIHQQPSKYQEELVEGLIEEAGKQRPGFAPGKEEIRSGLDNMYFKAISTKKEPIRIDTGVTFRRGETKPGRNDPCPCGSGKKYKKCCGRGL